MADEKKCCTPSKNHSFAIISIVSASAAIVVITVFVRWMYSLPPFKGDPNWITFLGQMIIAFGSLFAAALVYRSAQKQIRQTEKNLIENRRASLSERTAKAVEHLADTSVVAHYAGILELATLIDEWWIYQKQADVKEGTPEAESLHFRRQELCDIIFTAQFPYSPPLDKPLPSGDEKKSEDYQKWKTTQRNRARLMNNNFGKKESWKRLSLFNADLRDIHIGRRKGIPDNSLPIGHFDRDTFTDLSGVDLCNAFFEGTVFGEKVDLSEANLGVAGFAGAVFYGDVQLNEAILYGADFAKTKFEGDVQLKGADLSFANLDHANFHGKVDLSEAILPFVEFTDTTFKGNVTGINLNKLPTNADGSVKKDYAVHPNDFKELPPFLMRFLYPKLNEKDLFLAAFTKAVFEAEVNLSEANLYGADFAKTKFEGDVQLKGADLSFANLDHANFHGKVDLSEADLRNTDLTGADFMRLEESSFTGAIYDQFTVFPDGKKASEGTDFSHLKDMTYEETPS